MPKFEVIAPSALDDAVQPFPIEQYALHFLAQGDSWFSIGAFPFPRTTHLLAQMGTSRRGLVVNHAKPGATLVHMVDKIRENQFRQMLCGNLERPWNGLLISGLGNDAIDALSSHTTEPPQRRVLRTAAEWGPAGSAARYISEPGWKAFEAHAQAVYDELVGLRASSRYNQNIPIVTHTYDFATPRPAPAAPKVGPWLLKAMTMYGIPQDDWIAAARELLARVSDLILRIQARTPNMHVVQTQGMLTPARTTDRGKTAHWVNEIHPTNAGYKRLSEAWNPQLDRIFP